MSGDSVVVGGGPNGLVAACRLADAGHRVVVCERRETLGGLAAHHEFHPGFRAPGPLEDTRGWRPWVSAKLGLSDHGWRSRPAQPTLVAGDVGVVARIAADGRLTGASPGDTDAHARLHEFVAAVRPAIARLLDRPPPRLEVDGVGAALSLAADGWALRRLGRETMTELLRVAPMPAADWLRERFDSLALIEGLLAPAVLGSWLGPHSAGSAANLLALRCCQGEETVGGSNALLAALESACRAKGVEVLSGAEAIRVRLEGSRVAAVQLAGGDEVECDRLVATCDPKRAFALLPPGSVPLGVLGQIESWRMRGTLAKVHLALSSPFEIDGEAHPLVRLGTGSIDGLERAFDAVKYRRRSERPFLEIRQPSLGDDGLAPSGAHVLSIALGYAPHELEGGWSVEACGALLATVIDRLEAVAPGIRGIVVASELLTPVDLERRYGVTGGHQHHGEHALDQLLFMRPSHRLAHYATPVRGFFLGGSGSHPGGGLTGVPGWLGAGAALRSES